MNIGKIALMAATLCLAVTTTTSVMAQSTRNVGPNNVGPNNIGPGIGDGNNIGGGGYGCVNVTLAGSTSVRVCQSGYTARLGNIICSGSVQTRGMNSYQLYQAPCNQGGQNFLGGQLFCSGNSCNWNPSRAGRAQGFRPEYVSAFYN